jgi:hypothetical protein
LLLPVLAWAQQANVNLDYNPQKNTENLIPFSAPLNSPDVRDDGTITFRLKAPAAKEVRLTGPVLTALGKSGRPVPFERGEDGVWTLTAGPLKPDMYVYYFNVDGVQIAVRCVALDQALTNHKITHEYYVGGYGGHDWATWHHLLYYRFLPNLWRKN